MAAGIWELDDKLAAPEWHFDCKIDNWKVLLTDIQSPLHRWLGGERDVPQTAWSSSKTMSVSEWQVEHGFPTMTEAILKKFVESLGIDTGSLETRAGADLSIELKLTATKHLRPEWGEAEAISALRRGYIMESREASGDWYLDPELIDDVVLPGDRAEIKQYLRELKVWDFCELLVNPCGWRLVATGRRSRKQ